MAGFEGRHDGRAAMAGRRTERQIDWVRLEQRRSLCDELARLRYDAIDDLPEHKITHTDPNHLKYKCKTGWMTRLMFKLDGALRNQVLSGTAERGIAQGYIAFVRERAQRHRAQGSQLIGAVERVELEAIAHTQGPAQLAAVIAEKYWIPTTRDEIVYINQMLDALIRFLSADKRSTAPLEARL